MGQTCSLPGLWCAGESGKPQIVAEKAAAVPDSGTWVEVSWEEPEKTVKPEDDGSTFDPYIIVRNDIKQQTADPVSSPGSKQKRRQRKVGVFDCHVSRPVPIKSTHLKALDNVKPALGLYYSFQRLRARSSPLSFSSGAMRDKPIRSSSQVLSRRGEYHTPS